MELKVNFVSNVVKITNSTTGAKFGRKLQFPYIVVNAFMSFFVIAKVNV